MANRVSVSIVIGGNRSTSAFAELVEVIANDGLSTEWDGDAFALPHRVVDQPLTLYAHEVAWGRLAILENWCVAHALPFARWSGGYGGGW